jgi:hypothetical protein
MENNLDVSKLKTNLLSFLLIIAVPEIHVIAEEASSQKETIEIQFGANNLDKKDIVGKSDPYFTLSKQSDGGEFVKIYKSEVIKNNLSPIWKRLVIR